MQQAVQPWCLQFGPYKDKPLSTVETSYLEGVYTKNKKTIALIDNPTRWNEPLGVGRDHKYTPVKDVPESFRTWVLNMAYEAVEHIGEELDRRRALEEEEEEKKNASSPEPANDYDHRFNGYNIRFEALERKLSEAFVRMQTGENKVEEINGRLILVEKKSKR